MAQGGDWWAGEQDQLIQPNTKLKEKLTDSHVYCLDTPNCLSLSYSCDVVVCGCIFPHLLTIASRYPGNVAAAWISISLLLARRRSQWTIHRSGRHQLSIVNVSINSNWVLTVRNDWYLIDASPTIWLSFYNPPIWSGQLLPLHAPYWIQINFVQLFWQSVKYRSRTIDRK